MKLCWDTLEEYSPTRVPGVFRNGPNGGRRMLVEDCPICGEPFLAKIRVKGRDTFCSKSCARQGDLNPAWKGGVTANPEYRRRVSREYYKKSGKYEKRKVAYYEATARRRATLRQQFPSNANKEKIKQIYWICSRLNAGVPWTPFHVDHIIPLSKGGLHHEDNLQILPAFENLRKGSKLEQEGRGL